MAKTSPPSTHRDAVHRVRRAQVFSVDVPGVGRVRIPHPERLAYYGTLAVLAAMEIIDWPVALALAAGHVLLSTNHGLVVEEIGEALEEA